ncbi:high affinity immunoglobulin gamma Fc receptor I-like [Cheilinus undulatus]|uniref:high affinity immunoglobulin gamma Fc receptor I-like n=1 Tax=Cheilinus undulatus TaxID=241271 RepID=UPI001BD63762|nr:high affinity immunoglobulin gamma Fc receptor I-like [Cheilinus undulatus]
MDTVISLLVLSALPQLVTPQAAQTSFRAVAELVSGDSRVFSGESVRLKCSLPVVHSLSWSYLWFRGSEQLSQVGEHLYLWHTKAKDSGKYYCQGVRESIVGDISTIQSLPVEINVDGGWAILQVPPHPGLVGFTLNVTCRVRGAPQLHEVILYKNGLEIMRQRGLNPTFHLPNLTLQDQGRYSCRASWDANRRTHSVISAEAPVQVLEVVSQPILQIVANQHLNSMNKMKLICHFQYNGPAPVPPVHYYFYESENRLGTATSQNYDLVKQTQGKYRCKVKIPELGLSRWSEPKTFGQETGPQMMMPPVLHPRDPQPLAPPVSSPHPSLPPVTTTTAWPSPQRSSAASTLIQPTNASTRTSDLQLNSSMKAPSILLSTIQPNKQTAITIPVSIYEETGEMTKDSGGIPEESRDTPDEFGGMPKGTGNISNESDDKPRDFGDMSEESGDIPKDFGDMSEESGDIPKDFVDMSEESGDIPNDFVDMSEESGDKPEEFFDMSEEYVKGL